MTLPAAFHWRERAERGSRVHKLEALALAQIEAAAERGDRHCIIAWRALSGGPLETVQLEQLGRSLLGRGFQVLAADAGSGLRVAW